MASLKDKCAAVVRLDRAEDAVEDTRADLAQAARAGGPAAGYWTAYRIALRALASARVALDRVKGDA